MDTCNLKPGDIVRVKSGGPKMTVIEILEGHGVNCIWFTDDHNGGPERLVRERCFPPPTLDRV
jgi:uncharacterized protein YodC (DUF2158 family)